MRLPSTRSSNLSVGNTAATTRKPAQGVPPRDADYEGRNAPEPSPAEEARKVAT